MNKFLNILGVALLSCLIISDLCSGSLTIAINRSDIEEIEKLLEERGSLSQERKNKLLSIAKENIRNCGKATHLLSKSENDIRRIILGSASTLLGRWFDLGNIPRYKITETTSGTVNFVTLRSNCPVQVEIIEVGKGLLGVGLMVYGLTQIYRGWNLHSAFANLKKANEIKTLIQKCPVKTNQNI